MFKAEEITPPTLKREADMSDDRSLSPADLFVQVDRSRPIERLAGCSALWPELEVIGPPEYHMRTLRTFQTQDQRDGRRVILNRLGGFFERNLAMRFTLSVHDGLAIQEKGERVFLRVFGQAVLLLLRSATRVPRKSKPYPEIFVPALRFSAKEGGVAFRYYRTDEMASPEYYVPHFSCGVSALEPIPTFIQWGKIGVCPEDPREKLELPVFIPGLP
jgi:hypothetical protein